jgi:hypothetical protein
MLLLNRWGLAKLCLCQSLRDPDSRCVQIPSNKEKKYVIPSRYRVCVLKCLCGPVLPGKSGDKVILDSFKIESTSAVAYFDHGPLSAWNADTETVELPEIDGSVDLYAASHASATDSPEIRFSALVRRV